MKASSVNFSDLKQLLLELGFEALSNEKGEKVFRYPNSDVMIWLPAYYTPEQPLYMHHLMTARHTLDSFNIMEFELFDHFVKNCQSTILIPN
jgi:hypothetical protein